jgi:DNA repair exonuclease SbcCD ATPase subunit
MRHGGGKVQQIEALAFYLGAHGNDPEPVKQQLEALFEQETSQEKEEPLRNLHALEAKLQQVRKERPEAEAVWQRIRKELGDTPPPHLQAFMMAVFATFSLFIDTLFLAPTMDILNVASPALQYLAASAFAALFVAWFEISGIYYVEAKTIVHKWIALVAAGMGAFALIVWGLLRGHQLRFAAVLAGNPLGEFLGDHPILASTFFILVTLATPVVGAFALLYAWRDFSKARLWRRVRDRFDSLRNAELQLQRQVQTETEQLEQFDRRKEAECREWKEIFNHYYDRGQKNGARREPLWSVVWKSILGTVGGIMLAVFLPHMWLPAMILLPTIPGVGLFLFFNHRRLHPSHERYLARENTKFAVITETRVVEALPRPPRGLLSKGDEQ